MIEKYNKIIKNGKERLDEIKNSNDKNKNIDFVKILENLSKKEIVSPLFLNKTIEKIYIKVESIDGKRVVLFKVSMVEPIKTL